MPKFDGIRERWAFQAFFDKHGALEYISAVGKGGDVHYHDGVQIKWTAFPADFYVLVTFASPNAEHLIRDECYYRADKKFALDGPGFIVGFCVRDLA